MVKKLLLFSLTTALFFGSLGIYMNAWVHLHPQTVIVSGGCGGVPARVEITPEVPDRGRYEANLAKGLALMLLSGVGVVGGAVGLGEGGTKKEFK